MAWRSVVVVLAQVVGAIALTAELSLAQEPLHPILARSDAQTVHHPTSSSALAEFLAGGAFALGAHESGHLVCEYATGNRPDVHGVHFGPLPFFAISPTTPTTPRQLFAITSAGFWSQAASSEWILSRRPGIFARRSVAWR